MLLSTLFDECVIDVIGSASVKALANPLKFGLAVDRGMSILRMFYEHIS